ncbi:MAG: hypothetical protein KF895_13750 [Parvibaculum sp.]|nr:hypothetical protein [Parvibaculum sp.]
MKSEWIALRRLSALLLLAGLTACGGRVSNEVQQVRPSDAALTCDHLEAELSVNRSQMAELTGERQTANEHNAGKIAGAVLVPAYILFLDLSDTEKKEAEALMRRNQEIERLMTARSCGKPVKAPDGAVAMEPVS